MDKRDALIKKLLIGLKEAKNSIRTWHSMGAKGFEEEAIWKIYDTHSAEMKRLNTLIEETESEILSLKDEIEKEGETTYPLPTWEEVSDDETVRVLKSVNKYFIDLQNKCILTPNEENIWKKVSKLLNKIEVSDADIEAWAEDYAGREDSNRQKFIDGEAFDGFVAGVKSMRDGLIKKIEK